MTRIPLRERYTLILCLIALFALVYHLVILYPPYGNGLPSGFDNYVHAGAAQSLAENGFALSPESIYPAFLYYSLAFLYVVTGIQPIRLITPFGIAVDVLLIFPMFYITTKVCNGNKKPGLLAAFFKSIDPVTFSLVCQGLIPLLTGLFWLLLLISVLLSNLRNKPTGIILMGILSALIFFTHLLVSAFYVFLFMMIFVHEFVSKRDNRYLKPLCFSLLLAALPVSLYYVPRLSYFYLGVSTGLEYVIWTIGAFVLMPILLLPMIYFTRHNSKKHYVSATSPYLAFVKLWYVAPVIIALLFVWQASIAGRMWQFLSLPGIVVLSAIFARPFNMMKKIREPRVARALAATVLTAFVATTFVIGAVQFNMVFYATPQRLQLTDWTISATPRDARFCTEEEPFPTHLGWYISGLTGRVTYESLSNFSALFEVGLQTTADLELARNITSLSVGSEYWTTAVRELNVTYVVLLANQTHPNYEAIYDKIVFKTSSYLVYNITEYTFGYY